MIRLFYLVCCIFASCLVAQQPPTYKLLGETVTLDPFGIPISPDDILWKHEGNKVVEFNGNEQTVYGTFDNRITLDWVSAELTISDLRHEDSGVYALEAYTKQEMKRASFTLQVIDKVSKPTISCVMNNGSSSTESGIQATLRCSAEARLSPSLMKFEWKSNGKTQLGENLIIPLGDGRDDEVYDCTVSNPLTKESTTFTAKDCYPNEGSAGLAAGICAAIIAAILIILGVVFCKLKQKACFAKENRPDVEKQKGSENKPAQDDEQTPFLRRESTLPSKQRLGPQQEINSQNNLDKDDQQIPPGTVRGLVKGFEEYGAENNAAGLEKGKRTRAALPLDFGVDSVKEGERDPLDSKESNDVLADESENKNSDLQPTIVSDQQGAEETKSPPAAGVHLPAAEPHLLVTENSQNPSPQGGSGENEDQTVSNQHDQDTTGNNEGESSEPEEGKEPEDLNKKSPEENIKIQAVPPDPLESAENSEENPDIYSSREPPVEERDPSDSKKSNDASGAEEETDEEAKSPSENGVPPHAAQPHVPVTENSQNPSPQVGSGEHEDQTEGESLEPEDGKQPEDLKNKSPEHNMDSPTEQPIDLTGIVKARKEVFEPHNENQKAKEENIKIQAVSPGPLESAENSEENPDIYSSRELTVEMGDPSVSEKSNDASGDTSDLQPTTASEQPALEQKQDGGDDAPPSVVQPASPETLDAPNTAPEDGAGKPGKDSSSDQITGGTTDLSRGGSDSSSEEENESNDHSDVKDNPAISDEKDPETTDEQNSKQDETRQEDKQQERGNSEDNHDSNSENEQEKIDQKKKPPPVLPKKPQSFKKPKPDN